VADHLRTDLDELVPQRGQAPACPAAWSGTSDGRVAEAPAGARNCPDCRRGRRAGAERRCRGGPALRPQTRAVGYDGTATL
jgi:hypothetical protein